MKEDIEKLFREFIGETEGESASKSFKEEQCYGWKLPRLVSSRIVENSGVLHFLYRMPMIPCHATRGFVREERGCTYLNEDMLQQRDRLLQEHNFDMKAYVELGTVFMYGKSNYGKSLEDKFAACKKLFEMLTPIYKGLSELGCSDTDLLG